MTTQFRYPGVKPFETAEKAIFFGRAKEIVDLYQTIHLDKLVVLFGKSGYGKSSLLNAGILPIFQDAIKKAETLEYPAYHPIVVRFGLFVEGKSIDPLDQVRGRLKESFKANRHGDFLKSGQSLWYLFRRYQKEHDKHFLLVFDQFEEFFSYPLEQQLRFKEEVSELLYTSVPQSLRDQLDIYTEEERRFLARRLDVKAVFAIRADRLSELDSFKDRLPEILFKRFELKGLNIEQAREAIIRPAQLENSADNGFSSPRFQYSPATLRIILNELSSSNRLGAGQIEAFQLQILCQYIEREVIAGNITHRTEHNMVEVTPDDLPEISNVYEAYYRSQLDQLSPTERLAACDLIEYGLLIEDAKKGEYRRLSVDADLLVQQYHPVGVTYDLLKRLENTFLLRRETNSVGSFNYELSHDTLIEPVVKARTERQEERKQRENELRTQQAEEKAREEAKLRHIAEEQQQRSEQRRRRALVFSTISLMLLVVALVVAYYALQQRNKAVAAESRALEERSNTQKALNNFLAEQDKNIALQMEGLVERAEGILLNTACPVDVIKDIETLLRQNPDHPRQAEFQNTLQQLRDRMLKNKKCL